MQHLQDDDWFHGTRGFAEVTGDVAQRFRTLLGPGDSMPCGFLGHIVTELLLDAALIAEHPGRLNDYYRRMTEVDPRIVETAVNQMARGETRRLSLLIPLFIRERFLDDYAADAPLLARLNRVLQRVKLHTLPSAAVGVLAAARGFVAEAQGSYYRATGMHSGRSTASPSRR